MDGSSRIGIKSGVYIAALDGLRGIAVLAVVAFHLALYAQPTGDVGYIVRDLVRLGWVGVDLFFVLSGFLITGILYDNRRRAGHIRAFYGRRIVRIAPLYFAVIISYCVVAILFGSVGDVRAIADAIPWHASWLTNVRIAIFDSWDAAPFKSGHLWSLAVEEQFYLVWPALIGICTVSFRSDRSKDHRRSMMGVCVAVIVIAVASRFLAHGTSPLATYVLLPTRMDSLAVGAFIALWIRGEGGVPNAVKVSEPVLVAGLLGVMGVVGVSLGMSSYLHPTMQTVGYLLWAVLFGAVILQVIGHPNGPLSRGLESPWLMFIGRISYGIYLIHNPVIYALNRLDLGNRSYPLFVLATLLVTLSLAALSWYCLESPALRLKRYFPYGAHDTDVSGEIRAVSEPARRTTRLAS